MFEPQCIDDRRIPARWHGAVAGGRIERQSIGKSAAEVLRVRHRGRHDLFVKSEPLGALSELSGEIARLRWLMSRGLPGPKVLDVAIENHRCWLLMGAVAGRDLASAGELSPPEIVAIAAAALRDLHRVAVAACPFDHQIDRRLESAERRMIAGLVDETDLDEARSGRPADDLFTELRATRPATEDLVVTHGDACLPNLIAQKQRFSGFVDCGRLGVADRHQDLALAARSIARNLGPEWTIPFFRQYGIEPDARRLQFYDLLDEFF